MSTRTSRKSTYSSTTTGETPRAGSSTKSTRVSSPLSPTRISRLQEKADLQNLNDRLAAYIDRVRQLELENNRLNVQVETIQESVHKEVVSMKSLYEQELDDARKLLDDVSREKAKLQIDVGKLKTENEDLRRKLNRAERDFATSDKRAADLDAQVADLSAKLAYSNNERKKLMVDLKDTKDEAARLTYQLAESKKQLEAETLARVDLENRCQSLKEELQFKQHLYEKEITETRQKRHCEISEIDGRLQEEYEMKMQEALQELREQYEEQLRYNRGEVEGLYETKIEELNRRCSRGVTDVDGMMSQLKDARSRVADLSSKAMLAEASVSQMQQRVRDLEEQLDAEREMHSNESTSLKDELERLRAQMTQQLQEYQDLMDIKIALDLEIAAYRKLLESEEARLNLTPGVDSPRRTPMRSLKRKRGLIDEEMSQSAFKSESRCSGDIEISEECPEGKFVRLENKSDKDIGLGGFRLERKADDNETTYKFHRQLKIPANGIVTVWSSDTDQTHDAPHTLVMRNQKWSVAESMSTALFNADGEEIATRESTKVKESTTSSYYGPYGQKRTGTSPEKCSVM